MNVLFGMWYGRLLPTYHGVQRMSVFWFFRPRTARLWDFAVIGPLTESRAVVATFPPRKPICGNAPGAMLGAYFLRMLNISAVSGPTDGSTFLNSWPIQR